MPPKRTTETWRFGHEHREGVTGYRNRADRRQGMDWARRLVFCTRGLRKTPGGCMDIGCRSLGSMANGHRKTNLWRDCPNRPVSIVMVVADEECLPKPVKEALGEIHPDGLCRRSGLATIDE